MICYKLLKNSILSFLLVGTLLACDTGPKKLTKIEGSLISISPELTPDDAVHKLIKPYKEKVEMEMNTVLSYTPVDLVRTDGEFESSLGNLLADLCIERAQPVFGSRTGKTIDFALFNYGGIRAGISKGAITNQHAFELMPFENYLVVVEMSGDKIMELVDYLISRGRAHPVSRNFKLHIKADDYELTINGKSFDATKTYHVLTSDYLQNGGDNMIHFSDPIALYTLDYKMRNAIIDYLKDIDTVKVALDGRIKHIN